MLFTKDELSAFSAEFGSKLRAGVRSPTGILYSCLVLAGVGCASFAIPVWNEAAITPETLGIYVVGILVTVMADGLMIWKKGGDENPKEQAIAVLVIIVSLFSLILATLFSTKSSSIVDTKRVIGDWHTAANYVLGLLLILSIAMTLVLTGFDAQPPSIRPIDRPTSDLTDK